LVGAFTNGVSEFALVKQSITADLAATAATGQAYMPIIYMGFSSYNQSRGQQTFDGRPRACGGFLTMQTTSVLQLGANSFYVATFDEANEGTAVFDNRFESFWSPTGEALFLNATAGCANEGTLYLGLLGSLASTVATL
jgi:hypothetical protein